MDDIGTLSLLWYALSMALDALEKDRLRKKMATRMAAYLENSKSASCVSGHYEDTPRLCELCHETHAQELVVLKNRAGRKMIAAVSCLREMVRFQVVDVEDFARWLTKIVELREESEKRKLEQAMMRAEERKRLEKKVIIRKRNS